jgi:RHS repeat-associated protein
MNGNAVTLGYDGNNNRTSKTVGSVTTNYLVDELSPSGYAQVVEEQVAGSVRKAYVWGHMLISQRQLVGANWVTSYYGQDGSENVRQLFDNTGAATDTFDYDAFGILIGRTGTTANSYLYRSQQFDADLGFYYNRARYYDQSRGRFLSRDEFDGINNQPRSLHKYLYGSADPINRFDPSGYLDTVENIPIASIVAAELVTAEIAAHILLYKQIAVIITSLALVIGTVFPRKGPEEYLTLHRGVASDCGGMYAAALLGSAYPRGGHSDPEAHSLGDRASIFTSWSREFSIAQDFGTSSCEDGMTTVPGVVLTVTVPKSRTVVPKTKYAITEAEVLIIGPVMGARTVAVQ